LLPPPPAPPSPPVSRPTNEVNDAAAARPAAASRCATPRAAGPPPRRAAISCSCRWPPSSPRNFFSSRRFSFSLSFTAASSFSNRVCSRSMAFAARRRFSGGTQSATSSSMSAARRRATTRFACTDRTQRVISLAARSRRAAARRCVHARISTHRRSNTRLHRSTWRTRAVCLTHLPNSRKSTMRRSIPFFRRSIVVYFFHRARREICDPYLAMCSALTRIASRWACFASTRLRRLAKHSGT